jgi:putative transcriptional regulator
MKNRLRVLRAEYNWSQAELAERAGVSRQTINAIETEKYDPSLPLAFKIAHLFGKTIEEIFSPHEASPEATRPEAANTATKEGA